MEELKIFDLDVIKNIFKGKENVVVQYINYDREGKIYLSNLDEIDEKFYKLYIFNDECMVTAFNFGNGDVRYNKIEKNEIENSKINYYYLNDRKRLKVRVGYIGTRNVFQYIGIVGGEE